MKQIFTTLVAFMLFSITLIAQNGTGVTKSLATVKSAPSYPEAGTNHTGAVITTALAGEPTVNQPDNQMVCNNVTTLPVNFTGTIPGTLFSWTNNAPSIGLGISGTGNIPSFVATNTTNMPLIATITVTPYTGNEEFAYIPCSYSNTVTVINTATNSVVGVPIAVGNGPNAISVSPDGTRAYVINRTSNTVSVINTSTNTVVGLPIAVGEVPYGISVSPDGTRVYVTNYSNNNVSVINASTNTVEGSPIAVGECPTGIVVSPDGTKVYIANQLSNSVSVINTSSNTVVGSPIAVGGWPIGITVSPDGTRLYVVNTLSSSVSVINTTNNAVMAEVNEIGEYPSAISVSPDGTRLYVACRGSNNVFVINTATNTVVGSPIPVGESPDGISITPDGKRVYVTNSQSNSISVINTGTNTVVDPPIAVEGEPEAFGNFIKGAVAVSIGTAITFTISVNPTPVDVPIPSIQYICSGSAITSIELSGDDAGTIYNWTRDNIEAVTGIAAAGSGNISGTLTNTTNALVTVTFSIVPMASSCPVTAEVTVAPCTSGEEFAYITNSGSNTVTVINTNSNTVVGSPIPVGKTPYYISLSPDGTRAYVSNYESNSVSVINTLTNTVVGSPIAVGDHPFGISISPDGSRAYVVNEYGNSISVINTATHTVMGSPITVGDTPLFITISPDGSRLYVGHFWNSIVSVINTATNTVMGSPIAVGIWPCGILVSPDGTRVYVANEGSNSVSVINTATNTVMGPQIPVGIYPTGIALTPDGKRLYVVNTNSNSVSVINTITNTVVGNPILVGNYPHGISISPDGTRVYVANRYSNSISVINTATNTVVGSPISVGEEPVAFGNFIRSGAATSCSATGNINYQIWKNIGSRVSVSSLTGNVNYPNNPTFTTLITSMEGTTNFADNFGARITGYLCAPVTGNYTFWIASNNGGELWLSTDNNPANKQKIAYVTEFTRSREWNKYPTQKSATINLIQGHSYYIEALMKESNNDDNLAVGWLTPGESGTVPSQVIPGTVLSPYGTIPVSSVTLPPTSDFIAGPSIVLPATVLPVNATNKKLNWTSSDAAIAIVNSKGVVTGLMAGTATITATSTDGSDVSGTCVVTVSGVFPDCSASGNITYQVWNNIGSGYAVSSLTGNVNYPNNPTSTTLITSMEGTTNVADNYGARIAGYICAPATGSYRFWIASNNGGELWLSTDNNPANKQKIAFVTEFTRSREWNKYPTQKSVTINLIKGHPYYIEALMKESNNDDNLAVGWLKPGQTGTIPSEVIPGTVLSPLLPIVKDFEPGIENASGSVQDFNLSVYPNPLVDEVLNIRLENFTSETTLRIYTISGVKCFEGIIHESGIIEVNRNVFKKGIYIIKAENGAFLKTTKLVVN